MPDANALIHFCILVDHADDDELAQIIGQGVDAVLGQTVLDLIEMRELISRALARLSTGDILGYKATHFGLHSDSGGKLTH